MSAELPPSAGRQFDFTSGLNVENVRCAIDFTAMPPSEVVQVCQAIHSLTSQHFDLRNEMSDAFFHGLDYLAQEAPDLAADTYRALTSNQDPRVRQAAAISIYA